ncbi:MAG: hypothetical protein ACI392_01055 [Paludibacteraceae bacterium]
MPYRRLPNTDQARLRALERIADIDEALPDLPLSYKQLNDARTSYPLFLNLVQLYNQTFEHQVNANKKYQQIVRNARLYISHFIQVLNLAVIRGEIKKEHKLFYKLNPDSFTLPDLTNEQAITEWGRNIIDGENERMRHGGAPLQNPSIAKVKVHYDIFKEYKNSQKVHQSSTARNLENVIEMRKKIDILIRDIWDSIEKSYAGQPPYKRWKACSDCGIVYYLRKGEEPLTPESDIA